MTNKLAQAVLIALSVATFSGCDDGNNGAVGASGATGAAGEDGAPGNGLRVEQIGRYESGLFAKGGAEIIAYDTTTQSVFVVNSGDNSVDKISIADPANPSKLASLDVTANFAAAKAANSVAVHQGILAVAVQSTAVDGIGKALFYKTSDLSFIASVDVGVLPDMITFSPDGKYVLTANEGEPSDDYLTDPEGSISVINISAGVTSATVSNAGFSAFNGMEATLMADGVRATAPLGHTVAQDMEPEYIAISPDSATAWVSLQENNALAVVDIASATVTAIEGLGYKNHNRQGFGLDADKNDEVANIIPLPIFGMYQPDAIATYQHNGKNYIVTANEGDGRDYGGYVDEASLSDLSLDTGVFSAEEIAAFGDTKGLGDLTVTNVMGNTDGDPEFEEIYAFGARSFSIWSADGTQVYDSGDMMEQITAQMFPLFFNSNEDGTKIDNRSDNKGPEPEGVVLGEIDGRTYAFVGLERMGGIMVFDISNPFGARFIDYINNRDYSVDIDEIDAGNLPAGAAGDLAPEGMDFISASESPNGKALLIVGNEVSGTTTIYQVQ